MTEKKNSPLLHDFKGTSEVSFFTSNIVILLGVVVLLGVTTGFILTRVSGKTSSTISSSKGGSSANITKGTIIGSNDLKTFKDSAEGILNDGGIDGEGQFHLVRKGGDSQNVYLTSSLVDLSQFKERKIKVWGETHQAKKAGWLMDVGRVEVLE